MSFRGDSGLQDGNSISHNLVGGFYDSGNNIKFSFPTAYTITLLSWTVIEYHQKYEGIGELEHVKNIIKWGSDYLLKLFSYPTNASSSSNTILYSQASFLIQGFCVIDVHPFPGLIGGTERKVYMFCGCRLEVLAMIDLTM